MSMNRALLAGLLLAGCDRSGLDKVPQPNPDFPAVVEIGELDVMTKTQLETLRAQGAGSADWCANSSNEAREAVGERTQEDGKPLCYYGQVGLAEVGEKGGATFSFRGTGGSVCLIVDPETVFWNQSVAEDGARFSYSYPDLEEDDGDIDLFAGLSAYYTGSPGVEIGDFKGVYTDSLGNQTLIEYGLCRQSGAQQGMNTAHAGRATVEFCSINTANYADVEYTVVLETFSVPLEDGVLSFAVTVVDGSCSNINECTLYGESLDANGQVQACSLNLELAYCDLENLPTFCCANPEMCGEDVDFDTCLGVADELGFSDIDEMTNDYCASSGLCCTQE